MLKSLSNVKNIALALGSGSAKGIAHIGVIEALLNEGYHIKAVSGTSMGAVVAAFYAFGKLDILKSWFLTVDKKETLKNVDFSIKGGFISGKKLTLHLEEHLGNVDFENASIPLFIPATNLDLGKEEVFYSGNVISAIRASISIPGVLKPHYHNGYYYVDGAVTDPVPVDVLSDSGYKNIIAVHLHEYLDPRDSIDVPGVIEATTRSMSIVSKYLALAKMRKARVVIQPDLSGIGMFHMHRAKDIIEIGYNATMRLIENGHLKKNLSCIKRFWSFGK